MALKQKIGTIVSNKMQKTVIVKVKNRYSHQLYSKIIIKNKKYFVHNTFQNCNIGDQVLIEECRPLSKKKRWKLIKIL